MYAAMPFTLSSAFMYAVLPLPLDHVKATSSRRLSCLAIESHERGALSSAKEPSATAVLTPVMACKHAVREALYHEERRYCPDRARTHVI